MSPFRRLLARLHRHRWEPTKVNRWHWCFERKCRKCGAVQHTRVDDFKLADDGGAIPRDVQWPMACIDWDQAARELRMDYTSVDINGVTYWYR